MAAGMSPKYANSALGAMEFRLRAQEFSLKPLARLESPIRFVCRFAGRARMKKRMFRFQIAERVN
jgi:hypothetical protein